MFGWSTGNDDEKITVEHVTRWHSEVDDDGADCSTNVTMPSGRTYEDISMASAKRIGNATSHHKKYLDTEDDEVIAYEVKQRGWFW